MRSSDNGDTWEPPKVIQHSAIDSRHCGLTRLNDKTVMADFGVYYSTPQEYRQILNWGNDIDPALVQTWIAYAESLDSGQARLLAGRWFSVTRDAGQTWSEKIKSGLSFDFSHGGIQLPDGSLMFAISLFDPPDSTRRAGIGVFTSRNEGRSWKQIALLTEPLQSGILFGEPHILQLPGGRLIVMTRVSAIPFNDNSPLICLWESYSDDNGLTWSKPFKTSIRGFPPHLSLLSDGCVLCSYGYRYKPYGQRVCLSRDGITWDLSNEFILRDDAPNDDLGYPASVELGPGKILTVYYQVSNPQAPPSKLYAHPAGEKPAILGTIWTY